MNRQPYQTPPCWWSPRLSPRWVQFWRPWRRRRALRQQGLSGVDVQGIEHLRSALAAGHGVLITPNHPTHADPFVMLEASDQLRLPLYFLTAWQVFASTHWLGRRILRQHGCFSINREGHDLRAFRQAVSVLQGPRPLVIFPEGEVFHLNDRVTPFRRGAATAALRAARRSDRPVACVPCGMKYRYVSDPLPQIAQVMSRLEQRVGLSPRPEMQLHRRIFRLADGVLSMKEIDYFGRTRRGTTPERMHELQFALLGRLEDRYRVVAPRGTVPERVKELRRRVIAQREATSEASVRERLQRDLDDLFFVMQLFSYPADYLAGESTLERLAETVDKLEEDVLHVPTAHPRGIRKATVTFGEPVLAEPADWRQISAEALTKTLQGRVQELIDNLNGLSVVPADEPAYAQPEDAEESWNAVQVAA
jgi:1-acyl-sn-glycerol-3-phosphate acyltransferase